jgi:MarR family transcriptional regulator for hemolysin
LHLTENGRDFMNELSARADQLREEMLEGISDEDIEMALGVFHRIMENARKQQLK